MTFQEITVQPTDAVTHFETEVLLDGARYSLTLYTNAVDELWYLDIANDDRTAVVRGIGIASGIDLLHPYRHLALPPGQLFVRDKELDGTDPDLDAFTEGRAALYYLPAGAA